MHIALLSETWLSTKSHFYLSQYNPIRKDRPTCSGGVAILIHNSIKYKLIEIPEAFNTFLCLRTHYILEE